VIFHSYVSLPEGILQRSICRCSHFDGHNCLLGNGKKLKATSQGFQHMARICTSHVADVRFVVIVVFVSRSLNHHLADQKNMIHSWGSKTHWSKNPASETKTNSQAVWENQHWLVVWDIFLFFPFD
jgi:hypothetical protein